VGRARTHSASARTRERGRHTQRERDWHARKLVVDAEGREGDGREKVTRARREAAVDGTPCRRCRPGQACARQSGAGSHKKRRPADDVTSR